MVKHKRDLAKKPPPFVARVLGLLLPLGPVQARAMFGAHGLYLDGLIFAVVTKDALFFKIDAISRDRFIKRGANR
jgi:DNA transformation protein